MKITIYVTPTCPWSEKLRVWLKENKYKFEEWDVLEPQNKTSRDELLEKSNQLAVPMIDIDGQIIVGFNEKEIKKAIVNSQASK